MKVGTKSVLFGIHNPVLHGLTVAYAWTKTYGFPWDPRLWAAFFLHDIGYFGKSDMDGEEGSRHPELGASIMTKLFGLEWGMFTLCHSGRYARMYGHQISKLYVADKLAMKYTPKRLYLLLASLTGEINEYLRDWNWKGTKGEWFDECRKKTEERAILEKMFLDLQESLKLEVVSS